jgi:hypothetical protein
LSNGEYLAEGRVVEVRGPERSERFVYTARATADWPAEPER